MEKNKQTKAPKQKTKTKKQPKPETHSYELRKRGLGTNEIQYKKNGILKSHFSEWKLVHLFDALKKY